ncbi:glycerate kinase [Flagellimonas meishanensis]|uniref:glycerate kinase n=1 Tax=Flagellimonas meishanensis TaxID=2873264 RepID=UPI001CA725C9|nr:glycerate kinase [[Muricauda] meishanensis]
MKFVLAPDKYKGSLTGNEFCEAVSNGIRKVFPNALIIKKPLADGGDGTLEVVESYLKGSMVKMLIKDPLFRDVESAYMLSGDKKTAFVEMSEASGFKLLQKDELNCMHTTSFGTGQMILDAIEKGAAKIVLGIGGSATNDGGMGMAVALGFRFLDGEGNILDPIGKNLIKVQEIDAKGVSGTLRNVKVRVACDVNNPLHGPQGAAYVYGPQKGANKEEVAFLDKGLEHFANVLQRTFSVDVQRIPGAGAAGGLGAGAVVFLNAELASGVDLVMDIAGFGNALDNTDWIITGEGKLDGQTSAGKTIQGVLKLAKKKGVPVAALCGAVDVSIDEIKDMGLDYAVSIMNGPGSLEEAKANTYKNLELAGYNFANLVKKSKEIPGQE